MKKNLSKVVEQRPSELGVDKTEMERRESSLNQHAAEAEIIKVQKNFDRNKRILITGVNSLVGHGLFEQMRNDHLVIHQAKKADKFMGTLIQKDESTVPVPSSSITVLDIKKKPKTFAKSVLRSDKIIIDLLSGTDLEEAE